MPCQVDEYEMFRFSSAMYAVNCVAATRGLVTSMKLAERVPYISPLNAL